MRRFTKILLIIIVLFSLSGQVIISYADEGKRAYSQYGENMLDYLHGYNDELLMLRKNYGYMTLVDNFQSNWLSLYFLEMTDRLIKTGATPDKRKYMEVLINIITTYDLDNASAISEQYKMDNMKGLKDYALDFTEMGKEAISIIVGNSTTVSQLESSIATAIDGISVLANNTNNWINTISNLQAIIHDYTKYDDFLKLIEEKGKGELKEAASSLRNGMSEAIEIKLNSYIEVSNENFENYSEFFFSDVFFTVLKQTPEYSTNENVKFFVDCGDKILSIAGTLKGSWDLGKLIGKLVGNVVAGGENMINRLLEMMALRDISVILQEKVIDLSNEFIKDYGTEAEEKIINDYILYSQYLIGCRIRGEYCLYSTVAKDAGLLSWFNKKDAEEAKEWYEDKAKKILGIQDNLLKIYKLSELDFNNNQLDIVNTEDSLKNILLENVSEPILNFIYNDYDDDGSFEAIAFCGEYDEFDGSYFGTLYLVSSNGVKVIREKDGYWDSGELYEFENAKIIAITKYYTTGGITYYYQINGNEIIELEGSGYGAGLYQDEQGRMCMTDSQYDASVDGSGHTWNTYYFYWDNGLREYGGTEISIDEFSAYSGADEIIKKIQGDGFAITTIYKRKNGIININCCDGWSNNNVSVTYDNDKVELLPVMEEYHYEEGIVIKENYYQEGIIKAALIPEIATY